MNKANFEKLLQATREAPAEAFDMGVFCGALTPCGTPACLLGNYAMRSDLQSAFTAQQGISGDMGRVCRTDTGDSLWIDDKYICEHFDITRGQADRLFNNNGCNNAGQDRAKALAYVERFMSTGEAPRAECDEDDEDDDDWNEDDE